jgi:phosphatidylglycerophosphatase A
MDAATTTSRRPDLRFLVSHPAHFIALGFGIGLAGVAQGTLGTALTIPLYWGLASFLHPLVIAFLAVPLFFVGVWASSVTSRNLGVKDHRSIVIDEIVAFLPLAVLTSSSWWLQGTAFVLFRIFDIWKPFPIRMLETRLPGGLGVMADDLAAACYAYVALIVIVVVAHKGFGLA